MLKMKPAELADLFAAYGRLRQIQMRRIAIMLAGLTGEETQIGTNDSGFDIHWPTGGGLLSTREPWREHPEAWLCRLLEIISHKLGKDTATDPNEIEAEWAVEQIIAKAGMFPAGPEFDEFMDAIRQKSRSVGAIERPPSKGCSKP